MSIFKNVAIVSALWVFVPANSMADQAAAYQDAANYASTNQKNPAADPSNVNNVPQFTSNPPQTNYYSNPSAMETDGAQEMTTSSTGQFYTSSQTTRPKVVIDSNTDPTMQKAKQVSANADTVVGTYTGCSQLTQVVPGTATSQTCQEYRDPQFYTCNKTLNVQAASITRIEYYPSTCEGVGVFCAPWNNYCTVPTDAISKGYYYFFINSNPAGTMTQISSCTSSCDYFEINGMSFGRGTYLSWCDLNNCTSVGVTYSSEGIPTYACTGGGGTSASNCPSGYNKTTASDGKVTCRESKVTTYESNPICQKIGDVQQLSTGGSAKFYWEIWACDTWGNQCATFEARAP